MGNTTFVSMRNGQYTLCSHSAMGGRNTLCSHSAMGGRNYVPTQQWEDGTRCVLTQQRKDGAMSSLSKGRTELCSHSAMGRRNTLCSHSAMGGPLSRFFLALDLDLQISTDTGPCSSGVTLTNEQQSRTWRVSFRRLWWRNDPVWSESLFVILQH